MNYQYVKDSDVSDELDRQLRALLSCCFVQGNDAQIFSRQRYYNEVPRHRYMLWDEDELAAHIAVHEKEVLIDGVSTPICGIAEVCVHPDYRKQGLVKQLLEQIHIDRSKHCDAFSLLFGEEEIYGSSGYQCVSNLKALQHSKEWNISGHAMVYPLNREWPAEDLLLVGIPF